MASTSGWLRVRIPFKSLEGVADDAFEQYHFVFAQFLEFVGTAVLRQGSFILADKHYQIFSKAVGHLNCIHDAVNCFIVPAQIVDLVR